HLGRRVLRDPGQLVRRGRERPPDRLPQPRPLQQPGHGLHGLRPRTNPAIASTSFGAIGRRAPSKSPRRRSLPPPDLTPPTPSPIAPPSPGRGGATTQSYEKKEGWGVPPLPADGGAM